MEVMPAQNKLSRAVTLAYSPHPFGVDKNVIAVDAGLSIKDACLQAGVDASQPIIIFVNGEIVKVDDWCKPLAHGDFITVQAEVEGGGGGGGSNPLQIVAMIALTYFTMGAGAALWMPSGMVGTLGGAMLSGAVFMAGSMVINSVFAPSTPSMDFNAGRYDNPSPTYSLTGGSNRMRQYESMPLVMGTHRMFPDATMKPYTEYRGQDQYLYQTFSAGIIPSVMSDFRIGNTPLSQYQGVVLNGENFPSNVDTQAGFLLSSDDGWIQRATSTGTYKISIDIEAILYYANDKGGIDSNECALELEYRKAGDTTWLPFDEGFRKTAVYSTVCEPPTDEYGGVVDYEVCRDVLVSAADTGSLSTISNNSQKPLRLTYTFKPSVVGEFDVRVRKLTSDSTDARTQNTINVAAIRSYQPDNNDYSYQNRLTIEIKASDQLNGAVAQLSCVVSAKAQVWNGSAWVEMQTSNPAHWFMDFLKGRYVDGRLAYGLGLSNSQIDLTSLIAWAAFCDAEKLSFNAVIDSNRTASDVLQIIGRAGFGSLSWGTGKIGVIWDARNAPAVAVFNMANIIKGTFNVSYMTEQLADEFIISYVNPDADWAQSQVRKSVIGVEAPTNTTSIDLMGCTNSDMAGKFANYLASQQKYRRRRITWETDSEGFVCSRGDVILLSHDLTQWGYSGRVYGVYGDVVTLDRKVDSASGNYLLVRHSDGTMTQHTTTTIGNTDELTVSPAVVDDSIIDCVYTFSPLETQGKRVKIVSITPISETRLKIEATDDDDEFYSGWDGVFYDVPKQTLLSDLNPSVNSVSIVENLAFVGGLVVSQATIFMNWGANTERVSIKWRMNGGVWNQLTSLVDAPVINLGNNNGRLDLEINPISGIIFGDTVYSSATIYGKTAIPMPVTGFYGIVSNGSIVLNWDLHQELDVRVGGRHEIRFTNDSELLWNRSYHIATIDGNTTNCIVPMLSGTFLILSIDDGGRYSEQTFFVASEAFLTGFNTLDTITVDYLTLSNIDIDDYPLIDTIEELWDSVGGVLLNQEFAIDDYFDFGEVKAVKIFTERNVFSYGIRDLIDLIDDWDSQTLIDVVDIFGTDAKVLISTSDDFSGWTDYVPFVVADFQCRYARFKVQLTTEDENFTIEINNLVITAKEVA